MPRNAFDSLNRKVRSHNIKYLCPPVATYTYNCYSIPSRLFVTGGSEISSEEGTTKRDSMAMPVYAIGITLLLSWIKEEGESVTHAAFADGLCVSGKLKSCENGWAIL